jgi:hypothetical protein
MAVAATLEGQGGTKANNSMDMDMSMGMDTMDREAASRAR